MSLVVERPEQTTQTLKFELQGVGRGHDRFRCRCEGPLHPHLANEFPPYRYISSAANQWPLHDSRPRATTYRFALPVLRTLPRSSPNGARLPANSRSANRISEAVSRASPFSSASAYGREAHRPIARRQLRDHRDSRRNSCPGRAPPRTPGEPPKDRFARELDLELEGWLRPASPGHLFPRPISGSPGSG